MLVEIDGFEEKVRPRFGCYVDIFDVPCELFKNGSELFLLCLSHSNSKVMSIANDIGYCVKYCVQKRNKEINFVQNLFT